MIRPIPPDDIRDSSGLPSGVSLNDTLDHLTNIVNSRMKSEKAFMNSGGSIRMIASADSRTFGMMTSDQAYFILSRLAERYRDAGYDAKVERPFRVGARPYISVSLVGRSQK